MGQAADSVATGRRLEYFTLGYNVVEAVVSLGAGAAAGSVSLVGFGLDSLIEVTSGAALLWRLRHHRKEAAERRALRIVGWCLLALALYIAGDSAWSLARHETPERSIPGMAMTALSVVVMPLLARAKRRVADDLGSRAMGADAKQADFCAYLSAMTLAGLALNAALGWWWADPAAALAMAPIIGREGVEALKGRACCSGRGCS